MWTCKYCGKSSGFFMFRHAECIKKYKKEQEKIAEEKAQREARIEDFKLEFANAIIGGEDVCELENRLKESFPGGCLNEVERKSIIVLGIEGFMNHSLANGVVSENEVGRVCLLSEAFGISLADINGDGLVTRFNEAVLLRRISEGNPPAINAPLSVNLKRNEYAVHIFEGVGYLQDRVRCQYVGGSKGVSVRLARGVYLRSSGFKGEPVDVNERVAVDSGLLICTNDALYFIGAMKSIRIPYKKIISFDYYLDGVGVMQDAANAKAQIFVTGNGDFTFKLIRGLAMNAE